jgi:hypothetical protein
MGFVLLLHADLSRVEAIEGFTQRTVIMVWRLGRGLVSTDAKLRGALKPQLIDRAIEGTNLDAQSLLIGNTSLETIDIESYDIGTSGKERVRQRPQQHDALLEEFQVVCSFCIHGSGLFIQLMLVVFLYIDRWRRSVARRGLILGRLARTRIVRVFLVACQQRADPGGRR